MLTIGVTTHNESDTIVKLLDNLLNAPSEWGIIVYDDASTDDTVSLIRSHMVSKRTRFLLQTSDVNVGGPAAGRQFIADNATTHYTTLVDGDDLIDVDQLASFMRNVPTDVDMAICPYYLRGRLAGLKNIEGILEINEKTITHLISGIGGRVYRTSLLRQAICHKFLGRSEDARINLNMLEIVDSLTVYSDPNSVFYHIEDSRKSSRSSQINLAELDYRASQYKRLMLKYSIGDTYLRAVRGNLLRVIYFDNEVNDAAKQLLRKEVNSRIRIALKRIVLLCNDISLIWGSSRSSAFNLRARAF